MTTLDADVVVVGAGPTGLMLAAELALARLSVVMVERRDEFVAVPRGALRELLGTGEVEPDTFETARQDRHSLSPANL